MTIKTHFILSHHVHHVKESQNMMKHVPNDLVARMQIRNSFEFLTDDEIFFKRSLLLRFWFVELKPLN